MIKYIWPLSVAVLMSLWLAFLFFAPKPVVHLFNAAAAGWFIGRGIARTADYLQERFNG